MFCALVKTLRRSSVALTVAALLYSAGLVAAAVPPKSLEIAPCNLVLNDGRLLQVGDSGLIIEPAVNDSLTSRSSLRFDSRRGASATILPNGKVLIWGGLTLAGDLITTGTWFDPATNTVSEDTSISLVARAGHTATVLTDGRMLVTGGWNPSLGAMTEAELWDYRTNKSELLSTDLSPPRVGHSATLLADGHVLMLGGYDPQGHRFTYAALFDPAKVTFIDIDESKVSSIDAASTDNVPAIAESIPHDNAAAFPYDGLIALRFSRRLETTSLTRDTVTLLGPTGDVAIDVVPAEKGRLVFVKSLTDLLPATSYSLFVSGAHSREAVSLPFSTLSFTTAFAGAAASRSVSSVNALLVDPPLNPSSPTSGLSYIAPIYGNNDSANAASRTMLGGRLVAGSDAAQKLFAASCDNAQTIHGYRLCRAVGSTADGVFVPGHNNTNANWRVEAPSDSKTPLVIATPNIARITTLSGVIRRIDDVGVAGVSVSIGGVSTLTDKFGHFELRGITAGKQVALVDGTTANSAKEEFGEFYIATSLQDEQSNSFSAPLYLPKITPLDKINIGTPSDLETTITHTAIPGLEIHIPAGTVIRDRHGKILSQLALVPLPADRSPVPLPANFPVYFSLQPATAVIENTMPSAGNGLSITYPNYVDGAQGKQHYFWVYDALQNGWSVYSDAIMSADQTLIASDSSQGINMPMPGGYSVGGPMPPPTAPPPSPPDDPNCEGGGGSSPNGGPETAADPVDCFSGLFVLNRTDLAIKDRLPIAVTRIYRPGWNVAMDFGRGASDTFQIYLYSPTSSPGPPEIDLVLPNGSRIPFLLVSGNISPGGPGLWVNTTAPGSFYGARLTNNESETGPGPNGALNACGVCVTLRDGTIMRFPDNGQNPPGGVPSYIEWIRDRFGNQVNVTRTATTMTVTGATTSRSLVYSFGYSFGGNNYVSSVTDTAGNRTISYSYVNSLNQQTDQLQVVTYPDGSTEKYSYDPSTGNLLTVTDRLGNLITQNQYDSSGRAAQQTLADGAVYRWTYNTGSTDVTDPRGHVRHIVFDSAGFPSSVTQAYGTSIAETSTFIRGQNELITSSIDPLGRETQYVYDPNGNLLRETFLANSTPLTYTYSYSGDGLNEMLSATDPLGHSRIYSYTNGCLTNSTDSLGQQTQISCNASGQITTITDALGRSKVYTYAGFDLNTVTNAIGNTITRVADAVGRTKSITDAQGNKSSYYYDVNDCLMSVVDPLQQTTQVHCDANHNVKSITNASNKLFQFGYDKRNRKNLYTDALNQTESWLWDGMGNLQNHTDRKHQLTTYQFDALDRLSLVTYADGITLTPTFDAGNRLTNLVDSAYGTTTRTYDGMDHLLIEQTPQGTVSYTYDNGGNRQTMTPASQALVMYQYDADNRLVTESEGHELVSFTYDGANRRTSLILPNGVIKSYTYDNADEIIDIAFANATGLMGDVGYQYDDSGKRIGTSGLYSNRALLASQSTTTFDANNRQSNDATSALAYDANGNLLSDGNATYTWDARNHLVQVAGTFAGSFYYDSFGRRYSKTINGVTTAYLYDGVNPVQETKQSSTIPLLTGLGTDEYFARSESAGRRYYLTDGLGSTVALTDSNGVTQTSYSYDPYGNVTTSGSTSDNSYTYTGRELDGGHIYFYRARYFDSNLKRFISEDPNGFSAGLNEYGYAGENPITYFDPFGLQAEYEPPPQRGPQNVPRGQQSPFPRYTPPAYLRPPPPPSAPVPGLGGTWPVPLPGGDEEYPDAEDPNPPEYTNYCTIVMCYPQMCLPEHSDSEIQLFFSQLPLESDVKHMQGCRCAKVRPGDLTDW